MESITKEELLEQLSKHTLSDAELEAIVGGGLVLSGLLKCEEEYRKTHNDESCGSCWAKVLGE